MNRMQCTIIGALALLSTAMLPASVQAQNAPKMQSAMRRQTQQGALTSAGKRFMKMAAIGGMFEVKSSQLALKKSQRQDVRQFAQMMVSAHSQANNQLKQIARSKGVALPQALDKPHQRIYNQLARMNDGSFDNAYLKAQHMAHVAAVDVFSNGSIAPRDNDVRTFASQTLPDIRQHLTMVDSLRNGNGSAMGSPMNHRPSATSGAATTSTSAPNAP